MDFQWPKWVDILCGYVITWLRLLLIDWRSEVVVVVVVVGQMEGTHHL